MRCGAQDKASLHQRNWDLRSWALLLAGAHADSLAAQFLCRTLRSRLELFAGIAAGFHALASLARGSSMRGSLRACLLWEARENVRACAQGVGLAVNRKRYRARAKGGLRAPALASASLCASLAHVYTRRWQAKQLDNQQRHTLTQANVQVGRGCVYEILLFACPLEVPDKLSMDVRFVRRKACNDRDRSWSKRIEAWRASQLGIQHSGSLVLDVLWLFLMAHNQETDAFIMDAHDVLVASCVFPGVFREMSKGGLLGT